MAGLAAVKVELDVEGLPAPLLPGDALGRGSAHMRDVAGWEAQLDKLKEYKRRHGDCCVPRGWAEDKELGKWVHVQRWNKKCMDRGEGSGKGMTAARAAKLDAISFAWAQPG